jgi:hypothetical protein
MRLIVVAVLLLISAAGAHAKVYKWTDAQGRVHYSAKPPPNAQASEVRIAPTPPSARAAEKPAAESATTPAATETAEKPATDENTARQAAIRQNCEIARQNLSVLEDPSIRRFSEDSGETIYYTDEQRQAKIDQAKKMIQVYCEQGGDQ